MDRIMAFLTLNGLDISIANGQASCNMFDIGQNKRCYINDLKYNTVANKRSWKFTTIPLEEADAVALEGMLTGIGSRYSFEDDFFAKNGYGPTFTTSVDGDCSAVQAKFGSRSLYLDSGEEWRSDSSYMIDYDYTVSVWHYIASWEHLVWVYDYDTSTSTKYIDNSSGATLNNILMTSGGDVRLQGETTAGVGNNCYYDDLVLVPYKMTTDQITAIYNSGTGIAYSDLPYLNMEGDIIKPTGTIEVYANLDDEGYLQASIDGTWNDNLRAVSFTLIEK